MNGSVVENLVWFFFVAFLVVMLLAGVLGLLTPREEPRSRWYYVFAILYSFGYRIYLVRDRDVHAV